MTYDLFADPGHAWLKVRLTELHELGIAQEISHYSYLRGGWAYLEEDCDMPRFLRAKRRRGEEIRTRERYASCSSRVRTYQSFPAINQPRLQAAV
jgi:hypothetical protein